MLDAVVIFDGTYPYNLDSGGDAEKAREKRYILNNGYLAFYTPPSNNHSYTAIWKDLKTGEILVGCENNPSNLCPISSLNLAQNGLYYTSANIFNDRSDIETNFGVTFTNISNDNYVNPIMNNTNTCSMIGMRLPKMSEVGNNKVPNVFGAWILTSATCADANNPIYVWDGYSKQCVRNLNLKIECVR